MLLLSSVVPLLFSAACFLIVFASFVYCILGLLRSSFLAFSVSCLLSFLLSYIVVVLVLVVLASSCLGFVSLWCIPVFVSVVLSVLKVASVLRAVSSSVIAVVASCVLSFSVSDTHILAFSYITSVIRLVAIRSLCS